MKTPPPNQVMVYPHGVGWQRGGGVLDPDVGATPRLIHAAWQQKLPGERRRGEHVHDVYHIAVVDQGEGSMLFEGREVATRPGSLLIVSPGQPHCFLVPPEVHSVYSEVTFELLALDGSSLRTPLHEVLSDWTGGVCPAWDTGAIVKPMARKAIAKAIARIVSGCMAVAPRRQFLVNRALLDLLETVAEVGQPIPEVSDDPVQRVAAMIESDLPASLTVNEMAEEVGMSSNHLIRRFSERYGTTPLAYRQQLRIDLAINLLTHTHYPIKVVAEWTGFNSVHYFSRLFAAKVGTPPMAFRRARLEDKNSP